MEPLLEARDLWKIYPNGVEANRGVNIALHPGTVYALLGENGAGKTTLVKILSGAEKPTRGEVRLNGAPAPATPRQAHQAGVYMVPQHPTLFPNLTVLEDVGLTLRMAGARLGRAGVRRLIEEASAGYGLAVDPDARVEGLSVGERQRVEVLKGVLVGRKVLFLDEPSTHMSPSEVGSLVALARRLAREGRAVFYITHRIREALDVADKILIMRRGRLEAELDRGEASKERILAAMFGRIPEKPQPVATRPGGEVLRAEDLWVPSPHGGWALRGVSLTVRAGEILGVAGIAGNGQKELVEAIIGLARPRRGRILINGVDVSSLAPRARMRMGLAVVPEERLGWAVAPGLSIWLNTALPLLARNGARLLLRRGRAKGIASRVVELAGVRARSLDQPVETLSGGNIQRLVVGRELEAGPHVVVAMNPAAGLDYSGASMVESMLLKAAARGAGVLLVDEDLELLARVSSRIVVLSRGVLTGEFTPPYDVDAIGRAMTMR
ncbi:MAG: ATP-binding cassette domain-containing protein [Desulfurococcales archaeon]|nr:ATP-binding cassette domain-containing protein [Desulfurococcales archaeon]